MLPVSEIVTEATICGRHEWICLLCTEAGGARSPDEVDQRIAEHLEAEHDGLMWDYRVRWRLGPPQDGGSS